MTGGRWLEVGGCALEAAGSAGLELGEGAGEGAIPLLQPHKHLLEGVEIALYREAVLRGNYC